MAPTPTSPHARPTLPHASTTPSTISSATSTPNTTSPPPTPGTPTLFSRIRSSRSRSPTTRHHPHSPTALPTPPTRANSSPTTPCDPPRPSRLHLRSESGTSTTSGLGITGSRSRSQKRMSGTTMQVGRHGNEWLFGGFSFTETVKQLWSPGEGGDGEKGARR